MGEGRWAVLADITENSHYGISAQFPFFSWLHSQTLCVGSVPQNCILIVKQQQQLHILFPMFPRKVLTWFLSFQLCHLFATELWLWENNKFDYLQLSSVQSLRLDQMLVLQIWNQIRNGKWEIMILIEKSFSCYLKKGEWLWGSNQPWKNNMLPNN